MPRMNTRRIDAILYIRIERLTGGAALGELSKSAGRKMRIGPPQKADSEDDYRRRPSTTTERHKKEPQAVNLRLLECSWMSMHKHYYSNSTLRLTNLARASPLSWPLAKRAMSIN